MKLKLVWLMALVLGIGGSSIAGPLEQWQGVDYLSGRAIVVLADAAEGLTPSVSEAGIVQCGIPELDDIFAEFECESMVRLMPDAVLNRVSTASPEAYRTYILTFRPEYPVLTFLGAIQTSSYVMYAEPDLLLRTFRTPNDSQFNSQYDKTIMGAPAVWDLTTGNPDIICAGLDTGVDWRHPDLQNILWVNPDEDLDGNQVPFTNPDYPGDIFDVNGFDDGANGYIDDFLGWDFIQSIGGCAAGEDCDSQQDNDMYGQEPHGTHVAGIMVAEGNNGIGVAGFSWVGKLMALRCGYRASDGQGYMPQSATIPGTYYAIANGANIINMSYGGAGFSQAASQAASAAWQAGLLLFGASGNDNVSSIHYPAGYADVIAVNSTTSQDRKSGFSNYGAWTDISAPGSGIMSTVNGGSYQAWDGTSMASPNAAGAAALLWALLPDFTNVSIRDLMLLSAENIDALNPNYVGLLGAGRVDVENAARLLLPNLTIVSNEFTETTGDNDGRLESGEAGTLSLEVYNDPAWSMATAIQLDVTSTNPLVTVTNGSHSIGSISPGQSASVVVNVSAGDITDAFWLTLEIEITTDEGFERTINYTMRVGRGRVLVVDDDGSGNFQRYFHEELEEMGAYPDLWSSSLDGVISASEISEYQGVFWACGNETSNTLNAEERTLLASYLDGGGKLLLSGQGVRDDISGQAFFADYLHAAADGNANSGDRQVRGVAANATFGDINLLLQGGNCANNGTIGPDKIMPANGSVAAFEYTTVGGTGAVMFDGNHKVLYCAFSLEAACGLANTRHFSEVLDRTLEWWGVALPVGDHESVEVPSSMRLLGNYPNPFNPSSDIRFEINAPAQVQLNVFDIQGRLVTELVNEVVQPGLHSIRFDGSGLASGVYFAKLSSANFAQTAKMVLLK